MSAWWTYRLSDFLLFSPRTYYRLFELYNQAVWPGHLLAMAAGVALLPLLARRGSPRALATAGALVAACWGWVAWGYLLQRYATINWAATVFAAAFAVQAGLFVVYALVAARAGPSPASPGHALARRAGIGLLIVAVLGHPMLAPALGRPWAQAEVFGLAPDPTVLGSLGVLLLLQGRRVASPGAGAPAQGSAATAAAILWWALWPVPLVWCAIGAATLWALDSPEAWVLPVAAAVALLVAGLSGRAGAPSGR